MARIRRLEAGGTVVGLFDNMTYEEGSVEMHPGEIFLAYSDGVTEPENDFGEFGEQRLDRSGPREPATCPCRRSARSSPPRSMTGSATTSSRMTSRWFWRAAR